MRRLVRRRHDERGAAAVEFALVLTPMLYLIFGGIAYAYMFSYRQALSQSASEGARAAVGAYNVGGPTCASGGPFTTTCPSQNAAASAVTNALNTYGQSCGSDNLSCTIVVGTSATNPAIPTCAVGHSCISVTVSYPYRDHSLLPTVPGMGFVLPSDLTFTSVVQLT